MCYCTAIGYYRTELGRTTRKEYLGSEAGRIVQERYTNSDKCKATQKEYEKSEEGRATQKKYKKSDKGKLTQKNYSKSDEGRASQSANKKTDKGRASVARANAVRRSKRRDEFDDLTPEQWKQIKGDQDYKCAGCGITFSDVNPATEDHIEPIGEGPGRTKDNIQALCMSCNCIKGTKSMEYLLKRLKEDE